MDTTTTRHALAWAHGCLAVQSLGGMLGPALFLLPDGRQVAPLHVAYWANDPDRFLQPPILQELRGEWPCVPFGVAFDGPLSPGWGPGTAAVVDPDPHGLASNTHWQRIDGPEGTIRLASDHPADHPVERLIRTIRPDPQAPAIDVTLEVTVRRPCRLPIGLHPTFVVPERPGSVRLAPGRFDHIRSFPGAHDGDAAIFAADRTFDRLDQAPARAGGTIDAGHVPFADAGEDLLQLVGIDGSFALDYLHTGYRVRLSWDAAHFPSLILWFSNRGRTAAPWGGKHRALGVEPVCSAFDLGTAIAAGDNPIAASGTPTARDFVPGAPFVTNYRIAVEPLA